MLGAADTLNVLLRPCDLDALLDDLKQYQELFIIQSHLPTLDRFTRFGRNPIIAPILELDWQKKGTFYPADSLRMGKSA